MQNIINNAIGRILPVQNINNNTCVGIPPNKNNAIINTINFFISMKPKCLQQSTLNQTPT